MKYKTNLDQIGRVTSEVLISPPDTREGHEDISDEAGNEVQRFWAKMMDRYGSEKRYNERVIDGFKHGDAPEILIVVDKYLVGFDAPRNVVLYLAKSLKEHGLLQAIARVNRIFEGKDFGYIIDYYGLLGELDRALTTYSSLAEFDEGDLTGALTHVRAEIEKLAERHAQLWDIFKGLKNHRDPEPYEALLRDVARRDQFYDRLSLFARTLKIALSTFDFITNTPEKTVAAYKADAKFFLSLRASVKQRYSDAIDYKQYEAQIQNLINSHVSSNEVIQLTEQLNIFDREAFAAEVERVEGAAARADMIASRTARSITERMDEDPAYYKKFSTLLEETIEQYTARRISEVEYLRHVTEIKDAVVGRTGDDLPAQLQDRHTAKAFYGVAYETLSTLEEQPAQYMNLTADASLKIDDIISQHLVIDWQMNRDVQNRMAQELEDYLFSLKGRYDLKLDWNEIDTLISKVIEIAKHRYES
jgi:type I restriction enzyme, R subunit